MKNVFMKKLAAGIVVIGMTTAMSGCASTAGAASAKRASSAPTAGVETVLGTETDEEAVEDIADTDSQIRKVQDSLVYMGGLKTLDDAGKDIEFSIFRNEDGNLIGIIDEDGVLHYGIFTTEDAKLADGREYAKITIEDLDYGYYFNEDLTTGIVVDTKGTVYDAVELSEEAAREYVSKTLVG